MAPVRHLDQPVGGVVGHEQQAQRRAALAGRAEGRDDHVVDHLLAQRRGVDEHGVQAAGLGDERDDRAVARGQRAVDRPGGVGAAGEGDAVAAADAPTSACADRRAVAGQQVEQVGGQAGVVEQPHRLGGDQRRLFGGLGEHGVAGRQRRGDLAGEDGQREVPRADAGEDAAAVQGELVGLADRARAASRRAELRARPAWRSSGRSRRPRAPRRRRRPGSCRPRAQQSAIRRSRSASRASAMARSTGARPRRPARPSAGWAAPRPRRRRRRRRRSVASDLADHARRGRSGRARRPAGAGLRSLPPTIGPALSFSRRARRSRGQAVADLGDRKVDARRVPAARAIEVARQRDARVRRGAGRLDRRDRIGDHLRDRRLLVQQGVDEGGVGAVLQQPADQVGQQVLVAADRGVDPQREVAVALVGGRIERLAHAVQALELEADGPSGRAIGRTAASGVGVVGGELAVEVRRGAEQGRAQTR